MTKLARDVADFFPYAAVRSFQDASAILKSVTLGLVANMDMLFLQ
jgi:hypothetical protein